MKCIVALAKENKDDIMLAVHFMKGNNSRLEMSSKASTSFLKVSGDMDGEEFNSRPDSNFTGRMVTLYKTTVQRFDTKALKAKMKFVCKHCYVSLSNNSLNIFLYS